MCLSSHISSHWLPASPLQILLWHDFCDDSPGAVISALFLLVEPIGQPPFCFFFFIFDFYHTGAPIHSELATIVEICCASAASIVILGGGLLVLT